MPGVRIQHPTDRDCTFTLVDRNRPYTAPWTCPAPPEGCGSTHLFKTYHLRLDGTGAAIVSIEIVQKLKAIPGQPFRIGEEIKDPPAQVLRIPVPLIVRAEARDPEPVHQSILIARQRRTAAALRGRL